MEKEYFLSTGYLWLKRPIVIEINLKKKIKKARLIFYFFTIKLKTKKFIINK
jgi:hypothetical protein